jgi:phosphatidylglycerol:prolipoprotein diacylglycerol transferase
VLAHRRVLGARAVFALTLAWMGLLWGAKLQYRLDHFPLSQSLAMTPAEVLEPGMRIPLGLLVGAVLAGAWCLVARAPWRATGDALAVAASVLIPIGRVGCMLNGCCMGAACGPWASHWCPRYPAGTEAFNAQLRQSLVTLSDAWSLPAHPLPAYFALASLATLAVLVWLLVRDAPAGSLLAVFCIARPTTKLLFESLRADPRPPLLMLGIPASVLGVTLTALAVGAVRRASARRSAARIGVAAALVACALALGVPPAGAAEPLPPEALQQWTKALGAYLQDPMKQRAELRRLARRHGTEGLPVVYLMALADMNLRSSRERAAAELFEEVLAQSPGQPWNGWAEMALGGIAMRQGDDDGARAHLERAAEPGSPTRAIALVTLGMTDARAGAIQSALERFAAVDASPDVPPLLRTAARMGAAYTRYWSGEYDAAARGFKAIADGGAEALTDDARYGEARARWAAGERTEARALLEALAGTAPADAKPVSRSLVDLRPEAVFRAGFEKYRRAPFTPGDNLVAGSFNGDGVALARAALRMLDPEAPPQPPMVGPGAHRLETTFRRGGVGEGATEPVAARGGAAGAPATGRPGGAAPVAESPVASGTSTRVMWIVALLGGIVAGLLVRGGSRRGGATRTTKS